MDQQVAVLAMNNNNSALYLVYLVGRWQSVSESARSTAFQPCLSVCEAYTTRETLKILSMNDFAHHHSAEATQGIPLLWHCAMGRANCLHSSDKDNAIDGAWV